MASNLMTQTGNKYSRIVFNDAPVGAATGGTWNMMPFWRGNSPDGMAGNVTFFNWTWIPSEKYTGNGSDAPASWANNVEADAHCERSSKVGLFWGSNLSYIPIGNTTNALYTTFYNRTGNAGLDMSKMYGLGPKQATKHDMCLSFRIDAWNQSTLDTSSLADNWSPTSKTFTADEYINGETNGVPNREAYPFIGCIIAKPWLRMGNNSDGSDITDGTPRVAVKGTYGTSGGSVYIKYPHAGSSAGALAIASVSPQDGVLQRHKVGTSSSMTVEASKVEYDVTPLSADGQWYYGWGFKCHHCRYNGDGNSSTDRYYSPNLSPSETTNTPVYLHPMNVDSAYAASAIWTSRASATAMPYFHYIAWYKGANIIQLLNSLGIDWAETEAIAANGNPGDEGYHVPEVGADGTPTGFDENDPADWGTDWSGASSEDGETDEEGDPTVNKNGGDEPEPENPNTPPTNPGGIITNPDDPDLDNEAIGTIGDVSGTTKFVMNLAGVQAIRNYFNATYQPTDAELTANFKGRNPFDYIVSLKLYPFTHTVGSSQNIIIGGVNTEIAHPVLTSGVKVLDFGTVTIPAYFGCFLDYAPYTNIRLSVPFCGSVELDPAIYVGRTVGLKAIVDYNTGAMTAVVLLDGKYQMATLEGVAAIDMPLFGVNQGDYQNAVFDAQYALTMARLNERKATIGGFKSILTGSGGSSLDAGGEGGGSTGGAISSAVSAIAGLAFNMATAGTNLTTARVQTAKAEWDLDHTAPNVGSIGSASAINNYVLELKPKLTITRAKYLEGMNIEMYGRTVGYACLRTGTIGNFSGFTQFADVKFVNSTMNESERSILRGLFSTGIIV